MKLIENGQLLRVECYHPDDSTLYRDITVEPCEYPDDDESWKEWNNEVLKKITKFVNPCGYWHEVRIWTVCIFNNRVYKHEMQYME